MPTFTDAIAHREVFVLDKAQDLVIVMEMESQLTEEQKKEECKRLCGEAAERGVHTSAPVMCPILWDLWRKPPKRNAY